MEKVRVKKEEALQILKKNRDEHKSIFLEAVEGYRKYAVEQLEKHIESIKAGKVQLVSVQIPQPQEHTKDYDRAIKMLEMSVDTEIDIDEHSFQCFIMDDWDWMRQFLTSNSAYSLTAVSKLSGA